MNISWDQTSSILRRMNSGGMLKSTQDRLERQEKTQKQVEFYEKQKENLKNVTCESVEEIAEKLKSLHSYEDQIAAVKAAYNQEQMFHILDESTERGEKIAEAVDKMAPKTPEERMEELVEEALGIEDGGALEEIMDEMEEVVEGMTEEVIEELEEALPENAELSPEEAAEAAAAAEAVQKESLPEGYLPFDVRL
ncbi:MAG: hypothetical protein K2N43_09335 [Lachnospiraceae bacterium]|nr:hypothetical protein [Lachnospiraceae bacterium]